MTISNPFQEWKHWLMFARIRLWSPLTVVAVVALSGLGLGLGLGLGGGSSGTPKQATGGHYSLRLVKYVAVPNVIGERESQAVTNLSVLGLCVHTSTNVASRDIAPPSEVVSQRPAPSAKARQGSTVTLVVSGPYGVTTAYSSCT